MLSYTVVLKRGQKSSSTGNGALNSISVLSVGSAPGAFGSVLMLFKFVPSAGGTIDFKLKDKKAFLTGRIPGD